MKKIALLVSALAMLVACEKEEYGFQLQEKVTIGVSHEQVTDGVGRVAINENGTKFSLTWEGVEKLWMTTSTNNAYTQGGGFEMTSHDGASAQFTGTLPKAGDSITVTNYFAAVTSFMSRSMTDDRNQIRLAIATNQTLNGTNIANSCMLVGEQADCAVGVIPNDFSLKTMNAFIKIPVTKGSAAAGSTNTYANGMKLQSVKIEAVGGEQLAGRFGIDLNADDWSVAYATNTGISNNDKSSSITINCNDVELTDTAINLYAAIAFGTYAEGLKVTFNVVGDNDKVGKMERTIGGSGITIARNTMLSMPPVPVSPADASTVKYQLINRIADLTAGTYYMAGRKSDGTYAFTTGSLNYNKMVTTSLVSYSNETIDVTGAVPVTLEAVPGKENFYYIKANDSQYLSSGDGKDKLTLVAAANKVEWKATNGSTDGIVFIYNNDTFDNPNIYLTSSPTASSQFVRGYAKSQNTGVFFFKQK
ncbi:MAG: hypothetical protein IKZ12_04195 [Alistipes sp.]|nr:hypothetical protein [Alistipes sp.]